MTNQTQTTQETSDCTSNTPNKIKVSLSEENYNHKPKSDEIKFIHIGLVKNKKELTIKNFANKVGELGYTTLVGLYLDKYRTAKKEHPISSQQVLMVDIDNDNKNEDIMTIEQCLAEPFTQEYASFIYKTASHTEQHHKYRIVFILDRKVVSKYAIERLYSELFSKYRNVDKTTGHSSRLFFGSTKGVIPINDYKNSLDPNVLIANYDEVIRLSLERDKVEQLKIKEDLVKDKVKIIPMTQPTHNLENNSELEKKTVYKLLQEYNNTYLTKQPRKRLAEQKRIKELISGKWTNLIEENHIEITKNKFDDFIESSNYLRTLDLQKLLGLPSGTFLDIFHEETNPSANVFIHTDGNYIYKCYSKNAPFLGDILKVMVTLVPNFFITYVQANDFMCELLNIKVKNKGEIGRQKRTLDDFANAVMSAKLQTKYPMMSKYVGKKKEEMYIVCKYYQSLIMDNQLMTHISQEKLVSKLNKLDTNVHFTKYQIERILAKLLLFGILEIIHPDKQPEQLRKNIIDHMNKSHIREVNVVRVNDTKIKNHLPIIEEICKKLNDKKQAPSLIDHQVLQRTFGAETTAKVHPQAYKNKLSEQGLIKMSEENENFTNYQLQSEKTYREYVLYGLQEVDYILESEIVGKYQRHFRRNIYSCMKQINKIKWDIYKTYCIERIKVSRDLISKLNLPEQWLRKYLLMTLDKAEELGLINKEDEG